MSSQAEQLQRTMSFFRLVGSTAQPAEGSRPIVVSRPAARRKPAPQRHAALNGVGHHEDESQFVRF
jgi:hypothetical protein